MSRRFQQRIPRCVDIRCSSTGCYSIHASMYIRKGDVLDNITEHTLIPNEDTTYELVDINSNGSVYSLHSITNTLLYTQDERVSNGYIGYINHSCHDANIHFLSSSSHFTFQVIATRDIEQGEELTSNYLLFDYTGGLLSTTTTTTTYYYHYIHYIMHYNM